MSDAQRGWAAVSGAAVRSDGLKPAELRNAAASISGEFWRGREGGNRGQRTPCPHKDRYLLHELVRRDCVVAVVVLDDGHRALLLYVLARARLGLDVR